MSYAYEISALSFQVLNTKFRTATIKDRPVKFEVFKLDRITFFKKLFK